LQAFLTVSKSILGITHLEACQKPDKLQLSYRGDVYGLLAF
jgi:hypothetical protein